MKKIKLFIGIVACLFLATSCTESVVGTYRADLTIAQTGKSLTTIVLNSNGSATMTQSGYDTEHTHWAYAGKGVDIRIATDVGYWWFMDFDEGLIYFGADNYRSCRNGYKFTRIN